jgi:hypothetical protein
MADIAPAAIPWKSHVVTFEVPNTGPRAWKTYRRGGKVFWRNYRRDVPGGLTLVERIGELEATTRKHYAEVLERQLFG